MNSSQYRFMTCTFRPNGEQVYDTLGYAMIWTLLIWGGRGLLKHVLHLFGNMLSLVFKISGAEPALTNFVHILAAKFMTLPSPAKQLVGNSPSSLSSILLNIDKKAFNFLSGTTQHIVTVTTMYSRIHVLTNQ